MMLINWCWRYYIKPMKMFQLVKNETLPDTAVLCIHKQSLRGGRVMKANVCDQWNNNIEDNIHIKQDGIKGKLDIHSNVALPISV